MDKRSSRRDAERDLSKDTATAVIKHILTHSGGRISRGALISALSTEATPFFATIRRNRVWTQDYSNPSRQKKGDQK